MGFDVIPFPHLLLEVIDNRGKTCPTSGTGIPLIATNCIRNDLLYPTYEKARYVSRETYDTWFRAKVQEALADKRPAVPHDQVMRDAQALIDKQRRARRCKRLKRIWKRSYHSALSSVEARPARSGTFCQHIHRRICRQRHRRGKL